jgi:hypothetical protein
VTTGTTIRDVVIRIRIDQADAKLRAPDTSAWRQAMDDLKRQQAQPGAAFQMDRPQGAGPVMSPDELMGGFTEAFEQNDAAKIVELYKEVDRLSESVRAEAEAEKQAQKDRDQMAKEAVAAYGRIMKEREKAAAQQQRIDERTRAYADKIDPTGGNVIANSAARSVKAQDELEKATLRHMSAQKQQLEVFAGIGEAAIRAARGVAFLTAANEEDLKVAMRYVAVGQGVFDVLVGSITMYKQLAAARYAVAVAARTEAAVEAAAIPAKGTLVVLTAEQVSAQLALSAAMAGTSRAAVVQAGANLAAANASAAATAAGMSQSGANLAVAGSATTAAVATKTLTAAMLRNPFTIALVAATFAAAYALEKWTSAADDAGGSTDDLTKRANAAGAAAQMLASHWSVAMQQMQVERKMPSFDLTGGDAEKQIADLRKFQQERALYLTEREFQTGDFGGGTLGAARVQAQIAQEAEDAQREELSIRESVTKELERQQQFAANQLNLAKQTVETEKSRLQSLEERIGRLKPQEQARLRDIAKRREAGEEISQRDAEFLDQTGVGKDVAGGFFRKRGQEAGAGDILQGLGETGGLEQAQRDLQTANATFGAALEGIEEELAAAKREEAAGLERLRLLIKDTVASKVAVQMLEESFRKLNEEATAQKLAQ